VLRLERGVLANRHHSGIGAFDEQDVRPGPKRPDLIVEDFLEELERMARQGTVERDLLVPHVESRQIDDLEIHAKRCIRHSLHQTAEFVEFPFIRRTIHAPSTSVREGDHADWAATPRFENACRIHSSRFNHCQIAM